MACSHSPAGSLTLAGPSLLYSVTLALHFSYCQGALGFLMFKSQSHLGLTGRSSCHRAAAWPLCQASLPGVGLGERSQGEEQGEEGMLAVLGWGWGRGGEAFLYGVMSIPGEKRVSCSCLGLQVQMVHVHA